MGIAMRMARRTALNFSLKPHEKKLFKESWKWRSKVVRKNSLSHKAMKNEVSRQFEIFAHQVKGYYQSKELGHEFIHRLPTENQKYVIFSDHHWSTDDNRQNLFGLAGNRELYIEMLKKYYDEGYTVIENGDVEELVIFEPSLAEIDLRSSMNTAELKEYRMKYRKKLLRKIIDDPKNTPLYKILRKFHDAGRYVKIVGNHDYDLQYDETYEILNEVFPGIKRPYDYLFLESRNGIEYTILHGHQFDYSTNPVHAQVLGETISESLAWAYEGPDRNWKWDRHNADWAKGLKDFNNELVGNFKQLKPQFLRAIGAALGTLNSQTGWEDLFEHDIAWEYFRNTNPKKAYKEEVLTGEQWFKFRHMDEVNIKNMMLAHFPDLSKRPKLVLGHSHEVRFEPVFECDNGIGYEKFPYYFNTGAAGRFENLIWGLEIIDGMPKLVTWHREGNKKSSSVKRRLYYQNSITTGCRLQSTKGDL